MAGGPDVRTCVKRRVRLLIQSFDLVPVEPAHFCNWGVQLKGERANAFVLIA